MNLSFLIVVVISVLCLRLPVDGAELPSPQVDDLDQICADHMVMVFHAYDQDEMKTELDFSKPIDASSRFMKVIPYNLSRPSLTKDLHNGWNFKPIYGQTGVQLFHWDWRQKSLMGMVAYHPERKILSITYRGTYQVSDMWNNLNFSRRSSKFVEENILLHGGYLDIFEASLPYLRTTLDELTSTIEKDELKNFQILLTGYSLGGATSGLAAPFLRDYFPDTPIRLSVFGAPCVGGEDYNKYLQERNIVAKSFVRKTDYTPYNPSSYRLAYLGLYIELPDYGDRAIAWPMAHDCRKYQKAIYEILKQEDNFQELFHVHFDWLWNIKF